MNRISSDDVASYAKNPLFFDAAEDEIYIEGRPYRRPTRTYDNSFIKYELPLSRCLQASNSALSTHRMLLNIYEQDCMFLPDLTYDGFWDDFQEFYSPESVFAGETIRSTLEEKAFSFLASEVDVSGKWTVSTAVDFFKNFLAEQKEKRAERADTSPVLSAIMNSVDPQRCGRHYLVQFASDFLSEASAMARLAPGAYGNVQSAIFNILIDEYGASVHANKHSTLFENMLVSAGLSKDVHFYWQFYQPTALCMTNYFHYLTKNKRFFFRYIGALLYTEASLVNTAKKQSEMMKWVFGQDAETKYFDEHFHIDQHHGEMALERVIQPAFERFGDSIAREVVRGFMEFQLLEELANADLIDQFKFFDGLQVGRPVAEKLYSNIKDGDLDVSLETFVETKGERSTTHTHPDHRLLVIESGTMDFWPLLGEPLQLKAGDVLSVPRHRLHGSVVTSEESVYHQPITSPDDLATLAARESATV